MEVSSEVAAEAASSVNVNEDKAEDSSIKPVPPPPNDTTTIENNSSTTEPISVEIGYNNNSNHKKGSINIDDNIIKRGQRVCLYMDKNYKCLEIDYNCSVKINRISVKAAIFQGLEFGKQYQVIKQQGKRKFAFKEVRNKTDSILTDISYNNADEVNKDNREIVGKDNQKLTQDDILELKKELSGQELAQEIAKSNSSFSKRTEFSQAKYLNKKSKKHQTIIQILPMSIRVLAESVIDKGSKTGYLRVDSLANMLTLTGVKYGSNVITIDNCGGIMTSAVISKLGGKGQVISLTFPGQCHASTAQRLGLPDHFYDVYSEHQLTEMKIMKDVYLGADEKKIRDLAENLKDHHQQHEDASEEKRQDIIDKREIRIKKKVKIANQVLFNPENKFESLLVCLKDYEYMDTCLPALDMLNISGSFAIFSWNKESLLPLYTYLRHNPIYIAVDLFETWTREYQVLSLRTRAMNQMHGASGYVLTGMKIEFDDTSKKEYYKSKAKNNESSKKLKVVAGI